MIIKSVIRNKAISNSAWIIGQQVFQMLLQLVIGILTARYLGPSNYGTLNYTASFVAFFTSIVTLGMDGVIIKKMIDNPDKEGLFIGSCMGLRLLASFLSIISLVFIVCILNPEEPIKHILVLMQSFQLSFKAVEILDSWFQRSLKSKYVSIGKMVACVVVSSYKLSLLFLSMDIVWFAIASTLSEAVIAAIECFFYKREGGSKLQFSFQIGKQVLSESYHFIISGLMVAVYSQIDKIMIGQMMSDLDVGYYTTATAVCSMWVFIPIAIINSFQPIIMETKRGGTNEQYIRRLEQLYCAVIWLCIGVSIIVVLLAEPAILVLYGREYLGSVSALRIAIWYETFAVIGTARGIWILCENKNRYVKYYLFIGAVVNFILNLLLIPILGINGAALATLITQIITSLVAPLFFSETRVHTKLVLEAIVFKWRTHY